MCHEQIYYLTSRSYTITAMLAVLSLLFAGCTDGHARVGNAPVRNAPAPRGEIRSFEIMTLSWRVSILQNGSGSLGFGASDVAMLPTGTFDFVKWRNYVVSLDWHDYFDSVDVPEPQANLEIVWHNGVRETYYIDRDKIPIELFQIAVDATTNNERIRKIWSEKPLELERRQNSLEYRIPKETD